MKRKNAQRREAAPNIDQRQTPSRDRDAPERRPRERVALYLTATESEKLKAMRLAVVTAGLKPSDNSLVLAALRTLDLANPDSFIASYQSVQAEDGRRRD